MSNPTPSQLLDMKCIMFAQNCLGVFTSKIAASYLRYRAENCVGVVDADHVGKSVADILGYAPQVPIFASVRDALCRDAQVLIIGKGLHSAELPEDWKEDIRTAIEAGLHIISSIHYRLSADPVFAEAAERNNVVIWETKEPPPLRLNKARVLGLDSFIVHTCGSDSNIGKKTTGLQLLQEAKSRGLRVGFAGTGQSGMMITGHGIAIDGVPGDFVAGAVEQVVLDAAAENDWVILEGQGSLNHIGASGIALALLHGGLPHALIFCHHLGLTHSKVWGTKLLPIPELIRLNEELTVFERPAKVHAVSLNSTGFDEREYRDAVRCLEKETGLPVVDPVREGAGRLVDILQVVRKERMAAE